MRESSNMREIKFRIIDNNKIVGIERLTKDGWEWMYYLLNPDKGERWTKGVIEGSHEYLRSQFTGLKDKNGVEIYEGDILIPSNKTHRLRRRYKIEYRIGAFKAVELSGITPPYGLSQNISRGWDVIGNIHEHPHLLK